MGVKGLATFIKDNRQSLCQTVQLSASQAAGYKRTPVVVDAWGIVYTLWLSSLPWQSGGEYLRFYRIVCKLVEAWRSVGLEPTFVFDGSAPPEKLDTQIRRMDETLRTCQLFYTTSPASRSGLSFSADKVLLPAFASHTFIHALTDLDVAAHFVPQGEADGECVVIAERLGGWVFGQDSDYPILISAPGLVRVQGYCPLEMMMWVEDDPGVQRQKASTASNEGGWTVASNKREPPAKQSPLLPPTNMRRPKLIMVVISPKALRQRLRIPATMLPLFASLVGNDYTPPEARDHFFETHLGLTGKIEKVARIIREVVFAPKSAVGKEGGNAGDNAVELVKRIIVKLSWKPFVSEAVMMDLVEAIIESTFQYILPGGGTCCATYPFCGELDGGCTTRPPSRAQTPTSPISADRGQEDLADKAKRSYAMGQRRGIMQAIVSVWLYPQRVLLWAVLEDPSGPSLKATEGMRGIRLRAYMIAEEGLGGMRWTMEDEKGEAEETSTIGLEGDSGKEPIALTNGEEAGIVEVEDFTASMGALGVSSETAKEGSETTEVATLVEDPIPKSRPVRSITEYVRHTNRYVAYTVELPKPLSQPIPTCLLPLSDRLRAYLEPLSSAHSSMLALSPLHQPLAAITRFSALETSKRAQSWKRSEIEAVLKAFIWTLSTWTWEKRAKLLGRADTPLSSPLLTTRHSQIVAQVGAVMTDSVVLAQSLLLAPHTPTQTPDGPISPTVGRRMPTLPHMVPFIFFSGIALHTLLSHAMPSGWEWGDKEETVFQACWEAVTEGFNEDIIRGWSGKSGIEGTGEALEEGSGRKIKKKASRGGTVQKTPAIGRFGVLGQSQA